MRARIFLERSNERRKSSPTSRKTSTFSDPLCLGVQKRFSSCPSPPGLAILTTDVLASPSFVTVVTQQDILASGASDVAGALARVSGVVVNDYGPDGSTKTLSIRGSTSSQVLVLVDGIRMNSSFDGWVDLSRIPLDTVDRIEVVRGGASSLWGTGAVGGVINVITKKADKTSF